MIKLVALSLLGGFGLVVICWLYIAFVVKEINLDTGFSILFYTFVFGSLCFFFILKYLLKK
jgi:hypothetical protein